MAITDKIIAKVTASVILLGTGALIVYSTIYDIQIQNGIKELCLLLLGGAIAFLWKE